MRPITGLRYGALVGLAVGAAAVIAIGTGTSLWVELFGDDETVFTASRFMALGPVLGALVGAIIGGVLGLFLGLVHLERVAPGVAVVASGLLGLLLLPGMIDEGIVATIIFVMGLVFVLWISLKAGRFFAHKTVGASAGHRPTSVQPAVVRF